MLSISSRVTFLVLELSYDDWKQSRTLWRHHMETYSVLLTLYEGNPPVTTWIPLTKASDRVLMLSLICAWTNGWANNWDSSDLKHHHIHYDVTVMRATVITPHRSINSYYLNHNKAKHGKTYTVYFMEYDGFENNIPTPGGCWIFIKWTAPKQRSMPWGTHIFLEDCNVILKISATGHFMSNSLPGPDLI